MTAPRTLNELVLGGFEEHAASPHTMRVKRAGAWVSLSNREVFERTEGLFAGLRELGIAAGERLAILSENRPEWAIADFACLIARCADVPVYPTLPT
ncbi:MAG: AMP-binding protein, partial [Gemmatimonadota bacterium]